MPIHGDEIEGLDYDLPDRKLKPSTWRLNPEQGFPKNLLRTLLPA